MASPARTLVRQYELLLTARHRFQLADTIASLHGVAHALQYAELQLLRARDADATAHKTSSSATLRGAVERSLALLRSLACSLPAFLGDAELTACVRALRTFVGDTRAEFTAAIAIATAKEKRRLNALVASVVDAPERELVALKRTVDEALPVATMLRKRREHLVELVDASLAIVEGVGSLRTTHYEKEKARRMRDLEEALRDPSLREIKQNDFDTRSIEASIRTLLTLHTEVCLPITAANARVKEDAEFGPNDCEEINDIVRVVFELKDSAAVLTSILEDANTFLERIRLFEKAASKDAFVVFSSALKLSFSETLDEELFLAYVADWRDKRRRREELLASTDYQAASQRMSDLKDEIVRVQASIQTSRKRVDLDAPSKTKLAAQILDVFREAGGDITQVVPIVE